MSAQCRPLRVMVFTLIVQQPWRLNETIRLERSKLDKERRGVNLPVSYTGGLTPRRSCQSCY